MGKGGGADSTQTTKWEPGPLAEPYWAKFMPWMDTTLSGMGAAGPGAMIYGYNGQPMVAPLTDEQTAAGSGLRGLATDAWYTNPAFKAITPIMNGQQKNPYMGDNPYLESMINSSNKSITDNFMRGTAAATDAAAAQGGAFGGSTYDELKGAQSKGLAEALAGNESNLRGQNYYNSGQLYNQGVNQQLAAAGLTPQFNSAELQNLMALMGYGDTVQQNQQAGIEANRNLFNQTAQWPTTMMDLYMNYLRGASGSGGSSSSTIMGPSYSPWQAAGGLGLLGGGLYSALAGGG